MNHNRQPKDVLSVRDIIDRHHRRKLEDMRAEHPAYFREPEVIE